MIITKYYYTLREVLNLYLGTNSKYIELPPMSLVGSDLLHDSICKRLYTDGYLGIVYIDSSATDYQNAIFTKVFRRFAESFIIKVDEELTTADDVKPYFANWMRNYLNVYENTKFKYENTITYYNNYKTNLMDGIKGSSIQTNRINDTPFNGGDYTDDPHTSTYQKNENSITEERDSPIARLNEIYNKLDNIYLQWSNEFEKLFMEG